MQDLNKNIRKSVNNALKEDIGAQDISALLISEKDLCNARIISNQTMILCGVQWAELSFKMLNSAINIEWFYKDGDVINPLDKLCEISGNTRDILTAERTALNFLQTLSGTATITRKYSEQLTKLILLDTRKTIPNLRLAQKYATKIGGATNHRLGLYDAYLIKENHILGCGSITKAIAAARQLYPDKKIAVEVENLTEYQEALSNKPDQVLLDNFSLKDIKVATTNPDKLDTKIEISGNVTLHNIQSYENSGADYISVGAITKNIQAIDLSLRIYHNDN